MLLSCTSGHWRPGRGVGADPRDGADALRASRREGALPSGRPLRDARRRVPGRPGLRPDGPTPRRWSAVDHGRRVPAPHHRRRVLVHVERATRDPGPMPRRAQRVDNEALWTRAPDTYAAGDWVEGVPARAVR